MKSTLHIFIAGLCLQVSTYAQDIIAFDKGIFSNVKVSEVTSSEIKYFEAGKANGPLRTISKKSVYRIRYSDGTEEAVNPQLRSKYESLKKEIIEKHTAAVTSKKGLSSLKSLQFDEKRVTNADLEGTTYKYWMVSGRGLRMKSSLGALIVSNQGTWALIGNDNDGYKLKTTSDKSALGLSVNNPLYEFKSLALLVAQVDSINYFGFGKAEEGSEAHVFSVQHRGDKFLIWIDPISMLTKRFYINNMRFHVNFEKQQEGYMLPVAEWQFDESAPLKLDQSYYSNYLVNSNLDSLILKPDLEALNKSLANQKTLSIEDLLKFKIGDSEEKVKEYLKVNAIKFRTSELGGSTAIVIGEGSMNAVSLHETGDLDYEFIDFRFYKNSLINIRLAKYARYYSDLSAFGGEKVLENEVIKSLNTTVSRCVKQDAILSKLAGKRPSGANFWIKTKRDTVKKEKRYAVKSSGMKDVLISYNIVEDTPYICQELYLGLVDDDDIEYREPAYIKRK